MTPKITYNKDGSLRSLDGREAVDLYRVQVVIRGIQMHINTGGTLRLTRGATISHLLTLAGEYTGQKYSPRKKGEAERAMTDLKVWFAIMKSSIPTETK